jgi:hypothetical protein
MGGPHPDAVVPPSAPLSNGHARGTPVPSVLSPAARAGKEKQEGIFQQLAHANENTWMLIGENLLLGLNPNSN